MRLAAYQPDIPQNVGALMRLAAGFDTPLDLIEPFGFPWDERKIRQSAMDYYDPALFTRHTGWTSFLNTVQAPARIILMTTKAALPYTEFSFMPDDILLVGRESAGVPDYVHDRADARIFIPMRAKIRSFNVAMSGAIAIAEAKRQVSLKT